MKAKRLGTARQLQKDLLQVKAQTYRLHILQNLQGISEDWQRATTASSTNPLTQGILRWLISGTMPRWVRTVGGILRWAPVFASFIRRR